MVVRRVITKQGMISHTEIDLRSPHLQSAFREIFQGVEGLELNKMPPVAKPELIFWAAKDLLRIKEEEKLKEQPCQQLIDDIGTALRFVQEDYTSQIDSLKSLLEQKEITWDLLWTIFPPKEVIVAPRYGVMSQEQAFILRDSSYEKRENGTYYFSAVGDIVTFSGRRFGTGLITLEIDKYDGSRKIESLNCYPISHHPGESVIRERLITRGRKYLSLLEKPACRDYFVTYGVKEKILPDGLSKSEMFNAMGRVVADPEGYYFHNSSSDLNRPLVWSEDELSRNSLSDDQLLTCASWINGFSLSSKTWCQLAVTSLTNIKWNNLAFERLVLEETRRELIHGLVKAHGKDEAAFDDIVENKGKGLIALLTGSPGVGKTLTAEAVAEVTQRPLYVVATGELGVDADTVDERLGMILDITRRWGCVLLIDEADVFMASRGKDLARDALVSVFLRRLE
ncbi:uncharacterized protein N7482_003735 [Penicillium canariense]|uniref:AAA+ ATPase domain-containing protein n=1 Tax=Penicillium canariense TaxID=189055 RepID=A0A9W9I592_9EURO|nr:uncharacterized protein N7482_003735 [Penicillium canariense]KAJ5168141.1 hypothetical protein N7482_003735 [Penicillium canariense]